MLTREDNELMTRVGPGTPMGDMIRQYWTPVMRSSDLPERDSSPERIRLLGEDLVILRDTSGRVGLMAENCSHRGCSLFYGRNEEDGIRCIYHGWKYDVTGQCVDMPNEPAASNFKTKVRQRAYPCIEAGGMVWTYMGPRETPPPLPDLEWMSVPESHRRLTPFQRECNWVQALEGDIDTSHLYFLHGRLNPDDPCVHGRLAHGQAPQARGGADELRRRLRGEPRGGPRDDVLARDAVHVSHPHALSQATRTERCRDTSGCRWTTTTPSSGRCCGTR